jgi:hypothetical protein
MRLVINNKPAASIYDFSVDRTFDNNFRARLNCQIGQQISTNVQGAVLVNNRVIENGAVYVR